MSTPCTEAPDEGTVTLTDRPPSLRGRAVAMPSLAVTAVKPNQVYKENRRDARTTVLKCTVMRIAKIKRLRTAAVGLSLAVTVTLLAACGSGPASPGVASVGSSPTTTSSSGNGSRSGSRQAIEAKALKYSRCMRSHGISDFPDPSSNGSISISVQPGSDLNPHSPRFQAAQNACMSLLGNKLTSAEKAAANAKALKYSQCMRAHGVSDFPDPNGQGTLVIQLGTGGLDPNTATFKAAQRACQNLDNGFNTNENNQQTAPSTGRGNSGK